MLSWNSIKTRYIQHPSNHTFTQSGFRASTHAGKQEECPNQRTQYKWQHKGRVTQVWNIKHNINECQRRKHVAKDDNSHIAKAFFYADKCLNTRVWYRKGFLWKKNKKRPTFLHIPKSKTRPTHRTIQSMEDKPQSPGSCCLRIVRSKTTGRGLSKILRAQTHTYHR